MKLLLVRHGESKKNAGMWMKGDADDLSPAGILQAIGLGNTLRGKQIDSIYCSPTLRTEQTLDSLLADRDNEDILIRFSTLLSPKKTKESYDKLKKRIQIFLDDLKYEHEEVETIVVITHQRVLGMFLLLLDLEVKRFGNGEVLEIEIDKIGKVKRI